MSRLQFLKRSIFPVATIVFISMSLHCASPVGGDEFIGDNIIRGNLYNISGGPAAGASVVMRHSYFLGAAQEPTVTESQGGEVIGTTTTDDVGRFNFKASDSITPGIYLLHCISKDSQACACVDSVLIDSAFLHSNTWLGIDTPRYATVLQIPGVIRGKLYTSGDSIDMGRVWIRNLSIENPIQHDGDFIIAQVPCGNYQLTISGIQQWAGKRTQSIETQLTVAVTPGDTTTVGPFYGLIFNTNGATAGSYPAYPSWFARGDTYILPETKPSLMCGEMPFDHWNTTEDGSGSIYLPGDSLVFDSSSIMLYAQWKKDCQYRLTVASTGNGTVDGSGLVEHGSPHAISALPSEGYQFIAWRVTKGTAVIADSMAVTTTVILKNGDATIEGVFTCITFRKTYGGIDGEKGQAVRQTYDGGYIVTGYTFSFGKGRSDLYLVKTDRFGDTTWTRTYGGTGFEYGYSVRQTTDSGFIVLGNTSSLRDGNDIYLIKTTVNGETQWIKTFDGNDDNYGSSVWQSVDGGYIVAGMKHLTEPSDFDIFLVKTTSAGEVMWTRTFGENGYECARSIQQTVDGGYILTGRKHSSEANDIDVYLIKTAINGDTVWTKTFGGPNDDDGNSIQQTIDGGYIITGYTFSFGATCNDLYLIKTDDKGDTVWTRMFSGLAYEYGNSVQQTTDGGYIVVGVSSTLEKSLITLIKTDHNGNMQWTKVFDGFGASVQQTDDGGYIITGSTSTVGSRQTDLLLIKTDALGNIE